MLSEGPVLDHLSLECQVPLCFIKLCEQLHPSKWNPIRSLAIRIYEGWSGVIEGEVPSTSFDIPPTVTSLEINLGFVSDFGRPGRPLCISPSAYARLKSFSFHATTSAWSNGSALLQALQYCTSLENLTIDKPGRNIWKYDGQGWPVSLPSLRTLRLERACEPEILNYLVMPALTKLVVRGRQCPEAEDFRWDFPDAELRYPNLHILQLYAPLSMNPLKLATTLKCLPHLTELTLSGVVSNSHAGDDEDYNGEPESGHRREGRMGPLMRDVFQILHSWEKERGASRNLPLLQVLEILDLPGDYRFSYVCDYIAARLGPESPGQASDTLRKLTVTFLPIRLPNSLSCNFRDFKNVHEAFERRGLSVSITPSILEPPKRAPLYPFRL
ncbi:hypothetical protein H1R20_g1581, partial [Candolleomyces eurysporus]